MKYNHSIEHRKILADKIISCMDMTGFSEIRIPRTYSKEKVFQREIVGTNGSIYVMVYTTIEGSCVRDNGKDAIRVCAVYMNENTVRPLKKTKRVNRTGAMDDIIERMILRMRETYKIGRDCNTCRSCGAPMFISKSGNEVCARICWKT